MPAAQSAEFDAAVVASKKLVNKPSDDDLLDVSSNSPFIQTISTAGKSWDSS